MILHVRDASSRGIYTYGAASFPFLSFPGFLFFFAVQFAAQAISWTLVGRGGGREGGE